LLLLTALPAAAATGDACPAAVWGWSAVLFVFCLMLGVVSVVAGLGGGILYVPLVSAIFPFHLDFVRGAGLFVGLAGAVGSGPELLRRGLASPRLAVPFALFSSLGGIIGASVGLMAPRAVIEILLGITSLGVAVLMSRMSTSSHRREGGPIALALGMVGCYLEPDGERVCWQARYARYGLPIAFVIGVAGGLFGVGGGWAMVPTFTAVMGVPLKVAAASSVLVIALGNTGPLMIYLRNGSVLPLIVVPSVVGLMLGARLGAKLLVTANARLVRRVMVIVLMLAGARSLIVGLLGVCR